MLPDSYGSLIDPNDSNPVIDSTGSSGYSTPAMLTTRPYSPYQSKHHLHTELGSENVFSPKEPQLRNNMKTQLGFTPTQWCSITTGQLVLVMCNEIIPADLVLMATSQDNSCCYVDTMSLDGVGYLVVLSSCCFVVLCKTACTI